MEIFFSIHYSVRYSPVFWFDFKFTLKAIRIQGYLDCYVWFVLNYLWSCRINNFFDLHQKNKSVPFYRPFSHNSFSHFSYFEHYSPQYLTFFSWHDYSSCLYGIQFRTFGSHQLWFRLLAGFSSGLSPSYRHFEWRSNDIDLYSDTSVELDCRIWWKESIPENIHILHNFNYFWDFSVQ